MKSKQRMASDNGRWKGGKTSEYRRRITNAKPGELVHHVNHKKTDNRKSNFKVIKPGKGISAIGKHNKEHPERNRK
jgi:hypothetical protein